MRPIVSGIAVLLIAAATAAAASEAGTPDAAPFLLAQSGQLKQAPAAPGSGRPGSLAQPQQRVEQKCNGQTTEECCRGISYCTCLYPPTGGKNPLLCISSPP